MMLTREQNELVTRTGPGTPLGAVMRRYWVPVALSAELAEPGGPPVRLQALGERLIAFRDSTGRLGLLDELCVYRCASLFLGRGPGEMGADFRKVRNRTNDWGLNRQVAEGQDRPATDTSYYQVRAVERILPADVAWPEALRDAMFPAPVVAS